MKVHCFYHSADLDGHCSGAIVKHFRPEAILNPINYGDAFPWDGIAPDDTVFMVDFCLQPERDMERLNSLVGSGLIWIDHHKTALDVMRKCNPIAGFQTVGMAGCELTWGWFSKNPMPLAVKLLGRYDVWDHSDPRTLAFQYRMRMEDLDPLKGDGAMEKWEALFAQDHELMVAAFDDDLVDLIHEGKRLMEYEEQQNVKYCRAYAFETMLVITEANGTKTPFMAICLNRGMTNSKVFDSVYDQQKHHIMITFCRLPPHKQTKGGWTVSLYSTRDDVDCGAIAKTFGGGGHKGAAGFQCDTLPFKV